MLMKKMAFALFTIGIYSLSLPTFSADLHIKNNTTFKSTSRINGGKCSNQPPLGEHGITKSCEQDHMVTETLLRLTCINNKERCKADIYLTDNCDDNGTAPLIATVEINAKTSVVNSVTMYDNRFTITTTDKTGKYPFYIEFSDTQGDQCPVSMK